MYDKVKKEWGRYIAKTYAWIFPRPQMNANRKDFGETRTTRKCGYGGNGKFG